MKWLYGRSKNPHLKKGYSYLVLEKTAEKSYKLFLDEIKKGKTGLWITRQYPEKLIEKYKSKIYWLSKGETEENIDPLDIPKLVYVVCDFIKNNKNSVILLDGFEYLTTQNGFLKTLKYIQMINDFVMANNSTMIVFINPKTFDEKDLSLIKREMEVLEF